MKPLLTIVTLLFAFTTPSFAQQKGNDKNPPNMDQPAKKVGKDKSLTFEEFLGACQDPTRFQSQVAPSNIQVSCREVRYLWVPDQAGEVAMATDRQITTSVSSDKFSVRAKTEAMPSDAQRVSCPNFRQVSETVETVQATTCADLLAFTGTATQFCAGAIDALRTSNPAAITQVDTGDMMNLCGSQDTIK